MTDKVARHEHQIRTLRIDQRPRLLAGSQTAFTRPTCRSVRWATRTGAIVRAYLAGPAKRRTTTLPCRPIGGTLSDLAQLRLHENGGNNIVPKCNRHYRRVQTSWSEKTTNGVTTESIDSLVVNCQGNSHLPRCNSEAGVNAAGVVAPLSMPACRPAAPPSTPGVASGCLQSQKRRSTSSPNRHRQRPLGHA